MFDAWGCKCGWCSNFIIGERWAVDHIVALCNGGENREKNLWPLCVSCHADKTRCDLTEKTKVARVRKKHLGLKRASKKIPGSKGTRWRKKLDGTVVIRD